MDDKIENSEAKQKRINDYWKESKKKKVENDAK